jgi:phosphoglycolate phosphatase
MKYKACVFDFDLTLADSSEGILICFKHTLARFGYAVPDDVTIYNTIGMTLVDAFDLLTGITPNPQREQMRREYVSKADEAMVKNTFFYPGAVDILSGLREDGVKVGICSTKFRYRIVDSFERQAGSMPVDLIIGGEDVSAAKPDPSGLLMCIDRLGVTKSETLYVGDNVIDAQTAQRAGVDFAGVLTGSTTREEFECYPNRIIGASLGDIFDIIKAM